MLARAEAARRSRMLFGCAHCRFIAVRCSYLVLPSAFWKGHKLKKHGKSWGTPPNPRQGDPCTPFMGHKGEIGGHPQTPGRETPAPPSWDIRERLGDTPKPPAGRPLHPLHGT